MTNMWPFSHKADYSTGDLGAILDRLKSLEHDFKLLRVEWDTVYDKIVHQFDRERKRKEKVMDTVGAENGTKVPGPDWQDPVVILSEARKRGL